MGEKMKKMKKIWDNNRILIILSTIIIICFFIIVGICFKYFFGASSSNYGDRLDNIQNVTLKEEEYFLMGDNRLVSLDSRKIGPVSKEQIEGKTDFILYPFSKFGKINN